MTKPRFPLPDHLMVIGKRKLPKPKPREAAPFHSALGEDPALACPTCRAQPKDGDPGTHPFRESEVALELTGNLWPCEHCDGVFVENAAFEAMVQEMSKAPWTLPAPWGATGTRPCPACKQPMVVEKLGAVAEIDRCAAHGVWFDQSELGEALATISPPPGGLVAFLKNAFYSK